MAPSVNARDNGCAASGSQLFNDLRITGWVQVIHQIVGGDPAHRLADPVAVPVIDNGNLAAVPVDETVLKIVAVIAGAILDRFLHHAITIPITGRSYRVKDSLPASTETRKTKKSNEPLAAGTAS